MMGTTLGIAKQELVANPPRSDATERHNAALHRRQCLNEVQQALIGPGELSEKLKIVTDGVVEVFSADFCRIWITRPGDLCESGCMHAAATEGPHVCRHRDRCLFLMASSGRYTHIDGKTHRRVPHGCYKIGTVASGEARNFLTNEASTDPRVHNHDWAAELGLVAFAGYQLRPADGDTLGVMALFSKQAITEAEHADLEGISIAVAQVVQAEQARERLRASEERLALAAEGANEGIWDWDMLSNESRLSARAYEILGHTERSLDDSLDALASHCLPQDRERIRQAFADHLEHDALFNVEVRFQREDDTYIWIELRGKATRNARGEPTRMVGSVTNIHKRKLAEEELARVRAAVDDAADAVMIVESDGTPSYINVAFTQLLHCTLETIREDGWASIFDNQALGQTALDTVLDLDTWEGDAEMITKHGKRFPAQVRAAYIVDDAAKPTGMLLFIADITERKRAEQELKDYATALESSNAAMEKAKAAAEEARQNAERARDELAATQRQLLDASRQAGMAEVATSVLHNVGNVLNSVNIAAAVVAEKVHDSRVIDLSRATALLDENSSNLGHYIAFDQRGKHLPAYLKQLAVHLGSEREAMLEELNVLTGHIGHIKTIVTRQQDYATTSGVTEVVPVDEVVDDALQVCSATADQPEIEVVREGDSPITVRIDRQKLMQILVNVIRNAWQALAMAETSEKRLAVRTLCDEDERLRISVEDNGVGIREEDLARIFSYGVTTKPDGHGIGLHHSALAAIEMGGSLKASSDGPGKGATFTLELPIHIAEISE